VTTHKSLILAPLLFPGHKSVGWSVSAPCWAVLQVAVDQAYCERHHGNEPSFLSDHVSYTRTKLRRRMVRWSDRGFHLWSGASRGKRGCARSARYCEQRRSHDRGRARFEHCGEEVRQYPRRVHIYCRHSISFGSWCRGCSRRSVMPRECCAELGQQDGLQTPINHRFQA